MVFEKTVERVKSALEQVAKAKNPVILFDPDPDGTLSAALLQSYLKRRIPVMPATSAFDDLDLKVADARKHDVMIGFDTWTLYKTRFEEARLKKAFLVDHHPFEGRAQSPSDKLEIINPHQEAPEPYINTTEFVFRALPAEEKQNPQLEDLALVGSMADLAVHNCGERLDNVVSRYSDLFSEGFKARLASRSLEIQDITKEKAYEAVKLVASPMAKFGEEGALKLLDMLFTEHPSLPQILDPASTSPLVKYMHECRKEVDKFIQRGLRDFKTKSKLFPQAKLRLLEVGREYKAKDAISNMAGIENPNMTIIVKARFPKPTQSDEAHIRANAKLLFTEAERQSYIYKYITYCDEWVGYSLRSQRSANVSKTASDCIKAMRSKNGVHPNGGGHARASGAAVLLVDAERFERCLVEHITKQLTQKQQ
ncbi:hypothetical protein HY546_02520 [archaeon]|nr:hypothetical protein [archaeon]